MKSKIFLTGASGFIGSHIAEEFANKGYLLKLFLRKESSTKFLNGVIKKSNVSKSFGDILDRKSIEDGMNGCDMIIHNAAKVDDWGSYDNFYKINLEGTRNVLEAAKKNKIKQFILISSNAVLGEEDCKIPKNEESDSFEPEKI